MFSKYEVYTTVQSIYCYKGTNLLKNKIAIRDAQTLKSFEEEIVSAKTYALIQNPIPGKFTKTHLFHIHKFLFGDIYPFAGHIRKEQISKGDTMFYPPGAIDSALKELFVKIKAFQHHFERERLLEQTAYLMAELNIIHPFREGNGRTIREFIRQWLLHYDIKLNWGNIERELILEASVQSVDDAAALIPCLQACIENYGD